MTESPSSFPSLDLVRFLLCLLDLYEAVLESSGWDEAKANATLKTFMSSVLALMRVQRALGGQLLTAQHEMIRQYRSQLETWLEEHGQSTDGAAHGPVGRGMPR